MADSRQELSLPLLLRDRLDHALHTVMVAQAQRVGQNLALEGRCAEYALVGARVLAQLAGVECEAVAGGELLDCGDGRYLRLFPERRMRRIARDLSELKEFHCWIEVRRTSADGAPRIELVDFTSRHDREVALMYGVDYRRATPPDYLWCWRDEMPPPPAEAHAGRAGGERAWMWRDARCCELLRRYERRHDAIFALLAREVLLFLDGVAP